MGRPDIFDALAAWVGCLMMGVFIEAGQLFLASHCPDVNDVFWAGIGSGLGAGAALAYAPKPISRQRRSASKSGLPSASFPALARWPGIAGCFLWLGYIAAIRLWPFRFHSIGSLSSAVARIQVIPLLAMNGNSPLHTLELALEPLLVFMPLGAFFYALIMGWDTRWNYRAAALSVLAGLIYSAILEFVQLCVVGRVADITAVLFAGIGAFAGVWIYYRLSCLRRQLLERAR
jgi:VanZ family protein